MASVRGWPTRNCTVSTAMPGRDTEYTCSIPSISESICSAGLLTRRSTSRAVAPGKGMKTLAKVTLICGSSSRGVTSTANTPMSKPTSASRGVISLRRNFFAIVPARPRRGSAAALIALPPANAVAASDKYRLGSGPAPPVHRVPARPRFQSYHPQCAPVGPAAG